MTTIETISIVHRPLDEVFAALSDPRGELQWNPKVRMMEKLTDGPVGLGTQFKAKWTKSPVVTLEVTRFDPGEGWTFHNGGAIEVELDVHLEAVPEGTRVTARFTPTPHGLLFRMLFPLFVRSMRREEQQVASQYTAWIESGGATKSS